MSRTEHRPFEHDIEAYGRYQYTGGDRFSTVRANWRFGMMIRAAADMRGRRVVDVGCGDGTYTMLLGRDSGAVEVVGIDPARAAISAATAKNTQSNVSFRHGTATTLIGEGAHFDVAIYRGV